MNGNGIAAVHKIVGGIRNVVGDRGHAHVEGLSGSSVYSGRGAGCCCCAAQGPCLQGDATIVADISRHDPGSQHNGAAARWSVKAPVPHAGSGRAFGIVDSYNKTTT